MHETEGNLMRKFLAVAAVAALALAVAVPAMALDFKFGGEYRVRFYDGTNLGFANPTYTVAPNGYLGPTQPANQGAISQINNNPRGVQLRVRPRFDVSDDNGNITATLRLEMGDIEWGNGGGAACATNAPGQCENTQLNGNNRVGNGSGGALGGDGINVETKWAYMDFAMPFGIPLRVRTGLQPWYLPKGIIMDDDAMAVRAYGTSGIFSYDASWWRAQGGPATSAGSVPGVSCTFPTGQIAFYSSATTCTAAGGVAGTAISLASAQATSALFDNNNDFVQVKFDGAFAKWLNAGIYGVWGRNSATIPGSAAGTCGGTLAGGSCVHYAQFYGLTTAGDLDFMKYDFDAVFGRANAVAADGQDASGFVIDTSVHVPIGPIVWNVAFSYASGDKQDGGRHETMPWISPGWNGAGNGVTAEMIGSGGAFDAVEYTQDYPGGLITLGTSVEYRPVKALWLRAAYTYARFTRSESNCGYVTSATVGTCYGPIYTAMGGATLGNGVLVGGGSKTSFGNEINLRADYDLWTGFKIQGELGWLIPSSGSTAGEYILQLLYNF
jgi:hypothetical protein